MTAVITTLAQALHQQERLLALTKELTALHDALGSAVYPGVTVKVDPMPHLKGMKYTGTPTQERLAGATGIFIGLSRAGNAIVHTPAGPMWVSPDCLAAA